MDPFQIPETQFCYEPYDTFGDKDLYAEDPQRKSLALERHKGIVETPRWKVKDRQAQKEGTHGMVFFTNGDRYLGEWHEDKKHGNGIQITAKDGSVYEGEWKDGQRSGYGTLSVPTESLFAQNEQNSIHLATKGTSSTLQLSTKTATDLFHQLTTAPSFRTSVKAHARAHTDSNTPPSQAVPLTKLYAGYWASDQRNGQGTWFFPDGAQYEGEWRDNLRHGWGKMLYVNGDQYEGEWRRGRRHGQGVLIEATTSNIYSGTFMDDMKEGPGRYIYRAQRRCYEGQWCRDQPVCGAMTDLPALDGSMDGRIPKICLRDPNAILLGQQREVTENRLKRVAGVSPS